MGKVIQKVVERLYNEQHYMDPARLRIRLEAMVEREFERILRKTYLDTRMPKSEMKKVCHDGVQGYLRTMKAHKLLGTYARAEVHLLGWIKKWTKVGGYADMIIRREDNGVTILDGKNTKNKDSANPDQLRFYALLFWLSYRELPDRLGFVWYRYPHGTETPNEDGSTTLEEGVTWVPFTREDLLGLADRAVAARNGMRKHHFEATPEPSKCRYCDFQPVCPERQEQIKANAKNRTGPEKPPELEGSSGGFIDFSM